MKKIAEHTVLLSGDSYEACCEQVFNYFKKTTLVLYDTVQVIKESSVSASEPNFFATLDATKKKNQKRIKDLIGELEKSGINKVSELNTLEQGYSSKVLHLLSHFMDGFISIDSAFYNLVDDSHHLPKATKSAIETSPKRYWLIHVEGFSASPEEATLLPMHL